MRPRLSLCMIVRDEAEDLPRCLESVRGVAGDLVVVDTGSRDQTPELAQAAGARVFHLPWSGSFAVARNHALDQANGDWILVMDADEALHPDDRAVLPRLLVAQRVNGYLNTQVNFVGEQAGSEVELGFAIRLFRNRPEHRYQGVIHERVNVAEDRLRPGPFRILHYGYLSPRISHKGKRERNLALVEQAVAVDPDDPILRFYLGNEYQAAGRRADAVREWRLAKAPCLGKGYLFASKLIKGLATTLLRLDQPLEAVNELADGLAHFPDFTDLVFLQGSAFRMLQRLPEAIGCFHQCLAMGPAAAPPHFGVDPAMGGWRADHALGELYEARGEHGRAERHYRRAWEAGRSPARYALGRLAALAATRRPAAAAAEIAGLTVPDRPEEQLCLAEALVTAHLWEPALAALQAVPPGTDPARLASVVARCRFHLADFAGAAAALADLPPEAEPGLRTAVALCQGEKAARLAGTGACWRAATQVLLEGRLEALARGLRHNPGAPQLQEALSRALQEVHRHD